MPRLRSLTNTSMKMLHCAIALSCSALFLAGNLVHAEAIFFQNSRGIPSPTRIVTFSEFAPSPNTIITTQYQAYGVSFVPCVFYAPTFDQDFGTPHIDPAASAGNFVQVYGALQQFSIVFQQPVNAASFAVLSQEGTFDVTPLSRGVELAVGSYMFAGGLRPDKTNNFVGVAGATFDELRISNVQSFDHALVIDNIQFTSAAAPLLSHFTFDADGSDALGNSPAMVLRGVSLTNGTLFIPVFPAGLDATAFVPALSYDSFTVAVEFNPSRVDYQHATILSGGPFYRWMVLEADDTAHLRITLNNYRQVFAFTNTLITTGRWHSVICSVDVPSQTIVTFFDGMRLPDIALPGFRFDVIGMPEEGSEKVIGFINGGTGGFLSGFADNLRIFNRALTAAEIDSFFLRSSPRFYRQPQNLIVKRGAVAIFSSDVRSSENIQYRWYRNGNLVNGATSGDLPVNTRYRRAAGLYTLVASNSLGSVQSDPAYLSILDPVKITRQSHGVRVTGGELFSLRVRAKGSGPLAYQWLRDNEPLVGETGPTLTLMAGDTEEISRYQVLVSNAVSYVFSRPASVEVRPQTAREER